MNKLLITLALLTFASSFSCAQTYDSKDSLISVLCKAIADNVGDDSTRVHTAYQDHLAPFLDGFASDKRKEIATSIYYRMQSTCGVFNAMLKKAVPLNEEYEREIDRPTEAPKKKICRDLGKHRNYSHQDYNGDTLQVEVANGVWVEHFKDGSYSKLKMKWLTNCEFELEFMESDNTVRNSLSRKGDKYRYYVIGRDDNYFELAIEMLGTGKFLAFKIFH